MKNRWKTMLGIAAGIFLLAGAAACSQREVQNDDINPTLLTAVSFSVAEEEMSIETRSSLTASDIETKKTGITLAAFRDGTLYCKEHFSSNLSDVSIPLEVGTYTVYALVNMGDMTASIPAAESGMAGLAYQIPSYTEGDSSISAMGMPMAGGGSYTITSDMSGIQTISVKRLLCKVELTLNCTWPGGQIVSAKIFNMNKTLMPFSANGSAAVSSSDILSFQDVMTESGGTAFTATFYVPENRQGTVPGITNSSDKRPDGGNTDIFGKKDLLTYLQVDVTGSTKYVGTVAYRSYLGNNATSNFDLVRNTRYVWTVNYQEDGLQSDNWKVDRYLIAVPEAIDLGLSVKWASFNLGALSPEDYGDYYAWGETEPKEVYNWSTYKWCNGGNDSFTKYCYNADYGYNGYVDDLVVLDLEDDAAHVALGGTWRMPTGTEWRELQENCSWEWITCNGINGQMVTSKVDGYTDKWIFLPAAGLKDDSLSHVGSDGFYWSSFLDARRPWRAEMTSFDSNNVGVVGYVRYSGRSVRPVFEDRIVSVTYGTPSVTLSYNPRSFNENGGTAIPSVSYSQVITTTWESGASSTERVTSGGKITYNMAAKTGFTLNTSNGRITVAMNNTTNARSTTATAKVTLNGKTGTSNTVTISQSARPATTPEAVDLGLSVKWASFNLGATKPEDYGDYYAWGEAETYYSKRSPLTWKSGKSSGYDYPSYKWCKGTDRTFTKYCYDSKFGYNGFTDNKRRVELADDPANQKLGNSWRLPTSAQWEQLVSNCTLTWTKRNNVYGYKLTSKKNGKSIFLPVPGYFDGKNFRRDSTYPHGYYWSSTLSDSYPNWGLCEFIGYKYESGEPFGSGSGVYTPRLYTDYMARRFGYAIRPVL